MKKASLLALACIGAAAVLLFTTDKGKEIRGAVSDKAGDWGDTLSDLAADSMKNVKDMRKRLKKELSGLGEDALERINGIIDEGKKAKGRMEKDLA